MLMKFCIYCKWYIGNRLDNHRCTHPNAEPLRNPVTGTPPHCINMRTEPFGGTRCGVEGKWFEEKDL